jgi:hypothetical protein
LNRAAPYRVERVDSGGSKSVRSFATYEEAQSCVDQDRIFETKAAQAKRAELGRLAAALTVRATQRANGRKLRLNGARGLEGWWHKHANTPKRVPFGHITKP